MKDFFRFHWPKVLLVVAASAVLISTVYIAESDAIKGGIKPPKKTTTTTAPSTTTTSSTTTTTEPTTTTTSSTTTTSTTTTTTEPTTTTSSSTTTTSSSTTTTSSTTTSSTTSTTIPSGQVWYVVDFGADKTGVKDSSAAFQAAINAANAAGGGEVRVSSGTYSFRTGITVEGFVYNFAMKGNIRLQGEGTNTYLVNYLPGASVIGAVSANNMEIAGLNIRQSSPEGQYAWGIRLEDCNNALLSDLKVHNVYIGVGLYACQQSELYNSEVYDCAKGVAGDGIGIVIGYSKYRTTTVSHGCIVSNVDVWNCKQGIRLGGGTLSQNPIPLVQDVTVEHCYTSGTGWMGLVATYVKNIHILYTTSERSTQAILLSGVNTANVEYSSYTQTVTTSNYPDIYQMFGPCSNITLYQTPDNPNMGAF